MLMIADIHILVDEESTVRCPLQAAEAAVVCFQDSRLHTLSGNNMQTTTHYNTPMHLQRNLAFLPLKS